VVLVPISWWRPVDDGDGGRRSATRSSRWMLALEAMMIGVFAATDVFLFYVFFEAMLIPIYFLIGGPSAGRSAGPTRRQVPAVLLSAACSCWPRSSGCTCSPPSEAADGFLLSET
jgi:NADH-quinone oxidoreductase subunit M